MISLSDSCEAEPRSQILRTDLFSVTFEADGEREQASVRNVRRHPVAAGCDARGCCRA